jgi:medium-chain acyl-[acyl-carrier-protein] hydrolase
MMSTVMIDRWITCAKPNAQACLRLFCLPYAGGGSSIFRRWPQGLPSNVEVCTLQLPGRESRLHEMPFQRLLPLAETVAEAMLPHLDDPFALFGHSMGAKIAFEVARYLRKKYELEPVHLFVSGARAPQLPSTEPPTYNLPEPEFLEKLESLNGTPKEVLEQPELLELVIPLLRADFEVVQTYEYLPGPLLSCPITAYGGLQDEVDRDHLEGWGNHTISSFKLRMLPGDHFFLKSSEHLLLRSLASELYAHTRKSL